MQSPKPTHLIPLLLPLLLAACTPTKPTTPTSHPYLAPPHDFITIAMQRTPCFGPCPVYKITLHGHGVLIFDGRENVATKATIITSINPEKVQQLLTQARALGFFSMQNEYTANITDLPTTITTITINGKTKKVVDYANAPQNLKTLEHLIDQTANTNQWINNPPH